MAREKGGEIVENTKNKLFKLGTGHSGPSTVAMIYNIKGLKGTGAYIIVNVNPLILRPRCLGTDTLV